MVVATFGVRQPSPAGEEATRSRLELPQGVGTSIRPTNCRESVAILGRRARGWPVQKKTASQGLAVQVCKLRVAERGEHAEEQLAPHRDCPHLATEECLRTGERRCRRT